MLKLNHLLNDNATIRANKILLQNMQQITDSFVNYDPYIQAILIQSVINLSAKEFESISKDYFRLIHLASNSSNEWVRQKAYEFSEFPRIKIDKDIKNSFDISPLENILFGNVDSAKKDLDSDDDNGDSVQDLEPLYPNLMPPSSNLRPPAPLRRPGQRAQPKAPVDRTVGASSTASVLSIPKQPNQSTYRPSNDLPSRLNFQSSEKKKKKVKEFSDNPEFLSFNSKKKK